MRAFASLHLRYPDDVDRLLPAEWLDEFDLYFQLAQAPIEE
jgi:hypothetical protein